MKQARHDDGGALARVRAHLLGWLPVLAGLGILAQIGLMGLRPALAERERLQAAERDIVERHTQLRQRTRRLEAEAAAWEDPVFRERLRRLRDASRTSGADAEVEAEQE